tara:strand:- start:8498 stop:9565 length:1068 start_codon:yes stop_codon:yes gene_type:complete
MYNLNDTIYPLLSWYRENCRKLPWRENLDSKDAPYRILVSEFMLQQTTVNAVRDYFNRFISRWPSIDLLSEASEDDVLFMWSGLGYYSRGTNLLKTAQIIAREYNFKVPDNAETLKLLPGIGEYISSAIVSIAYNKPSSAADTNIQRVITRLFQLEFIYPLSNRKKVRDMISLLTNQNDDPRDLVQGLMDLGSLICRPKDPKCEICPLNINCLARKNKSYDFSNASKNKNKLLIKSGFVFLIKSSNGRYMINKREPKGLLASTYQFPSTDWKENLVLEDLFDKEFIKRNGLADIGVISHQFSHFKLKLSVIRVTGANKKLINQLIKSDGIWVAPNEFDKYGLSSLMKKVIRYTEN